MNRFIDADDNELIKLSARGDKRAFARLMRRHLAVVVNFNKQYLPQDAEDVAQEAFLRLWHNADQWQDKGISVRAWLLKVSYRLCIDTLRRQKPQAEAKEIDDSLSVLTDPHGTSESQLCIAEDLQRQKQALQRLPENQRAAILLCAYTGLSNKEAADVLHISVDALESLLARGRRKLKALFLQNYDELSGGLNDDT